MPSGGIVSITGENIDDEPVGAPAAIPVKTGRYVRISIHDEGVGIDEAHKDKIFDPYFSTKDKGVQKGMGLDWPLPIPSSTSTRATLSWNLRWGPGPPFKFICRHFGWNCRKKKLRGTAGMHVESFSWTTKS